MARAKKTAGIKRSPVTSQNLMGIDTGNSGFKGGVKRPVVTSGVADGQKARAAKIASGGGVGGQKSRQAAAGEKTAGMLIDNVQTSRAFMSGYALESYRTSYANGLNNRSGTYDIPGYFVQMNQLNGGILYWPVTLQEKYQWFRYFARTDPYVGRALDLLTDLPMSKITLNMPKMEGKEKLRQEIQDFFSFQVEKLNLFESCQNILWESNCLGNCFIFNEFNEEKIMWERSIMLPPEEVYTFQYPFSESKRIEYRPERLMSLIKSDGKEMVMGQSGLSEDILDHIPQEIVDMVRKEGCIVMDNDPMTGSFVAHIARRKHPYMDLGASILERVLVPLLQKENYRYTQLSLANRNMTPKNLITAPGLLQEELDNLRTQVDLSYLDPDYSIITNYDVQWNQIGAQDRILNLDSEYERIDNQTFAAMGVTRELLTGEGSYSGTKISVEILNTMFLLSRETLKNYIEKQLFMPIAEKRGWFETGPFGVKKYWYPQVGFNRLTIRDNNEVFESLFQLYQKGSLNVDVIYELFNLNGDQIRDKLLEDVFTIKDATFNRLLEEVHAGVGRTLPDQTDVLERIAKAVGLNIKTQQPQQGQEQGQGQAGFGTGFGEEGQDSQNEEPVSDSGSGEPLALFPNNDEESVSDSGEGEPLALFPDNDEESASDSGEGEPLALFPDNDEESASDSGEGEPLALFPESGKKGLPTLEDLANEISNSVPSNADEKDINQILEGLQTRRVKKIPSLKDISGLVADNLPAGASDEDISFVVNRVVK